MKILVTGAAGFIGFFYSKRLVAAGHEVVGLDNLNDYYDPNLKLGRLAELGVKREALRQNIEVKSKTHPNQFCFYHTDLCDYKTLENIFDTHQFDVVCNLGAQAGVRYSLENPKSYLDSNLIGFFNILELCRHKNVGHLIYASSSSVYGLNTSMPFKTTDQVDNPVSLYAATKKSNELMAHTYSHLYGFKTTGLRFFTVYGPWGRPDMAMFLFTDAILNGRPIKVFNNGQLERDFTYVDDIVEGIFQITVKNIERPAYKVYNIGNSKSVRLMDFISEIENCIGTKAEKIMMEMQPGDVLKTWADVSDLKNDYGYQPNTPVTTGIKNFVDWYKGYYKIGV